MIRTHGYGQGGQVGLVVLLVGAVLMTIGLGVASQSVMEIRTASQETDSSQTFNAAERGIETVLINPLSDGSQVPAIPGYQVKVDVKTQTDNYQGTVLVGHSAQLNMNGVSELDLSWTDAGCGTNHSAIVVTFIESSYGLTRQAYGQDCGNGDGFIAPPPCAGGICTIENIDFPVDTVYARIKAVYNDTQITAGLTGVNLPPQYYAITSTATRNDSGEARSVQVNKSPAAAPSIFDYALFSGADLIPSP